MITTLITALIGLAAGIAIGWLLAQSRHGAERTQLVSARDVLQAQVNTLNQQLSENKTTAEKQLADAKAEAEKQLQETKTAAERQLAEARTDAERQLSETRAAAEKQLSEAKAEAQQQKTQMKQQGDLIREQINTASEEILKKRSEELSATNKEQLSAILTPLHENLKQMREAVEKTGREQATTMERLDVSIKENLKQAKEVGERADKLAQALTSENKTQGNFGELRLRTLLENMGLEEGTQFEEQVTLRDDNGNTLYEEEGHRMIPDVILHFPDNRDVVIDSKMSLKAFEDYHNAETQEAKDEALQRHILSVRNHVKELSHKNYSSYLRGSGNKLDFVVMYIYSESAVQLALANDASLWKEAYDQGVIISGSQTLYMMLRVLEMTWRQVRQVENQDKIMATADELVNRVQMFYERFQTADDQLGKTQKAFDALRAITAPTGASIATSANKLLKYGAKENPKRKAKLPVKENE